MSARAIAAEERQEQLMEHDEYLARILPEPATQLIDGQMVSCQGSGKAPYTLTRLTVGQYKCSCHAFSFGKGFSSGYKTCKHLRALLGDAHELIRAPSTEPLPKLAKKLIQFTEYIEPPPKVRGPPAKKAKKDEYDADTGELIPKKEKVKKEPKVKAPPKPKAPKKAKAAPKAKKPKKESDEAEFTDYEDDDFGYGGGSDDDFKPSTSNKRGRSARDDAY